MSELYAADPEDSIIKEAGTHPLSSVNGMMSLRKLTRENSLLEYRMSAFSGVSVSVFFIIGLALIAVFFMETFGILFRQKIPNLFILAGGIGCIFGGSKAWQLLSKPISFDREKMEFRGMVTKPLQDIYAIQLLIVNFGRSYEMNLIMNDSQRVHVQSQPSKAIMMEEAKKISEFLGKPVITSRFEQSPEMYAAGKP